MISQTDLEKIIESMKKQREYEDSVSAAFGKVFPSQHAPFLEIPLWSGISRALDSALGLGEDFFEWWIWETDCGENESRAKIWLEDGTEIPVRNAEEIIRYSEMCNKK